VHPFSDEDETATEKKTAFFAQQDYQTTVYTRLLAAAQILAIYRESRVIHEQAASQLTFSTVTSLRDQSTTRY